MGKASTTPMEQQRRQMVQRQLAARGIRDPRVLAAMGAVPREAFVDAGFEEFAYDDSPLPIAQEQTISQPWIVARMLEAARLEPGERALEVGTGSGYAAAVMAGLADRVYTIERHAELAANAQRRLQQLGYINVSVRHGDGTLGWPEAAPFDVILVAAAGADIPEALCQQLAPGGRMVIPVGEAGLQSLRLVRRTGKDRFDEQELDAVRFVPLVAGGDAVAAAAPAATADPADALTLVREAAEPLPALDDPAFGAAFDRYANARVVLLGEASHGTSEFYRARAAITARLVSRHGFRIIAAEADWPDAAVIDRHVRQRPSHGGNHRAFERFPTWMWRNTDFAAFVDWLHAHNAALPAAERAGFHGLDLYSLGASIRAIIDYLDDVDADAAKVARARYGCLTPWQHDPAAYGRMAASSGYGKCEQAVVAMLRDLMAGRLDDVDLGDGSRLFDATQNAHLVANAERYYRSIYRGAHESWNLRDTHMAETLERLLEEAGPDSRAVVWAHNSHVGNAAFTEMGQVRDELNLGQLCRQRFGDQAMLIGFGTHTGSVAAADDWDEPMQVKTVRPSLPGSYERLAHDSGVPRFLLDLRDGCNDPLRRVLAKPRLERFIGVIYRPETERLSHYAQACLPGQFDAYVWFDETRAVTPTPVRVRGGGDETYPFGL